MKNRGDRLPLALVCAGWLGLATALAGDPAFHGGAGTPTDPYQISTVQQLQEMRHQPSAHYVLVRNLEASAATAWDGGKGFSPVGDPANPFTGTFDGRGHTITGLTIKRFGQVTTHIALFGITGPKARVQNVQLANAFVEGCDCVGALVGVNQGTISQCYVSGEVHGSGTFGGLVGGNNGGTIAHCAAAVTVKPVWVGNHLGGLVGSNNGGTITDCFATGTVTGLENPGGLVGVNTGTVQRCYAAGAVASSFTGASDEYRRGAGGLVAQNQGGGTIKDCFATGQVTGPAGLPLGGLLGINLDQGRVGNSYFRPNPDATVAGVGRNYPDAGVAECENVAEIGAALFTPGTGPLASWNTGRLWTWSDAPGVPLFTASYAADAQDAPAAGAATKRTLVATVVDGSRVIGTPLATELKLVSPDGEMRVPLARLVRLALNGDREPATLVLNQGERLSGVVKLAAVDLQADWGTVSIPLQYLRTLALPDDQLAGTTAFDVSGALP